MLDGMFSFVVLDKRSDSFFAARDPIGITPLYIGWGKDGSVWVSSEMKCIKVGRCWGQWRRVGQAAGGWAQAGAVAAARTPGCARCWGCGRCLGGAVWCCWLCSW
jgi:hypothetical protein